MNAFRLIACLPARLAFVGGTALLLAAVGCEESTSGADRVGLRITPDASAEASSEAGSATSPGSDGGGGSGGSGGTEELPPCVTCGVQRCGKELTACGDVCLGVAACLATCSTVECESGCLRAAPVAATAFKLCVMSNCGERCASVTDLFLGVAKYAEAQCDAIATCAPDFFPFLFRDVAHCEERVRTALLWTSVLPGSGVSGPILRGCAAATNALADCDEVFSVRRDAACDVRGSRKNGESCLDDEQCASGFCPSAALACAACATPPAAGAPCVNGTLCGPGMVCSAARSCVAPARRGQACTVGSPCELPLRCRDGICQAPGDAGDPCVNDADCDFRKGLVCGSTPSGTLCRRVTTVQPGETCGGMTGGPTSLCRRRAACVASGPRESICQEPPGPGEPCDDARGPYCTFPEQCINGRCAQLPAVNGCP